jgi:threonine-phosphate decarboxylase
MELDKKLLVFGNGSTELIYLTIRALRPKRVLIPCPTFNEYERQ